MKIFNSFMNGVYAFLVFNLLYFLGRGFVYLLDIFRGLKDDFIQGIGIELLGAGVISYMSVKIFTHGLKIDIGSYFGFPSKYPLIVSAVFILLVVYSRFFIFYEDNFLFYFKDNKTINTLSVILIVLAAILATISKEEE